MASRLANASDMVANAGQGAVVDTITVDVASSSGGPLPEAAYRLPRWQVVEGECELGPMRGTAYRGPFGAELVLSIAKDNGEKHSLRLKVDKKNINQALCWMVNGKALQPPVAWVQTDDRAVLNLLKTVFQSVDADRNGVLDREELAVVVEQLYKEEGVDGVTKAQVLKEIDQTMHRQRSIRKTALQCLSDHSR